MADPIKKVVLGGGKVRYRFVLDVGRRPDGGRRQLTVTRDTEKEARAEYGRLVSARESGTLIVPSKITVSEWLDEWLASKVDDLEVTTLNSYAVCLKRAKEKLGHIRLQELTEEDVIAFVRWMLTEGHARYSNRGLTIKTAASTLARFREALARAMVKRLVAVNVASEVGIPRQARKAERKSRPVVPPWNLSEVQLFVAGILDKRLYAVHLLSLMGMRPAEVCGLRWEDIDFDRLTLSVCNTRTMINNHRVVEKDTKSEAGDRVLPVPGPLNDALRKFKARLAKERLAVGGDYVDSGYVAVDEIGQPLTTADLRNEAYRLMDELQLRRVRLYDARASCLTYLANKGVPRHILARWAGHTNPRTTDRFYIKPDVEDLRDAARTWEGLSGVPNA
ncbi:tyrosine-type recombinase/integrase [Streptomyces sp. NPDC093675]|uniref:tyrosine-type recombinase/integrase n=1 Tax=Streptomyces sp. NPDC093675 TaxID=3366049 RepID=UPI0038231408